MVQIGSRRIWGRNYELLLLRRNLEAIQSLLNADAASFFILLLGHYIIHSLFQDRRASVTLSHNSRVQPSVIGSIKNKD
jgi:hypothetical protein